MPNTRKEVRPIHPGEMLGADFMPDYGLTVAGLGAEVERIKPLKVA